MPSLQTPAPTFDDVWRTIQELALLSKQTELSLKETERLMKEQSAETERLMKERSVETERKIDKLRTEIGNLGNRLGEFVQEMVKPGLEELFQQRGLKVHRTMENLKKRDDAGRILSEVDLLVVDSDVAIAVECKSHLSVDDVNEHLRRLAAFKEHWPEYARYRLLGAVAAMVLPEDVGRNAYRKGLYVLAQKGERVEIRNDMRFKPKEW